MPSNLAIPTIPPRLRGALALLCLGLVLGGYLWRCQYGLDTYDEPYYLAPGFNLMPQGDLPFRNEVNNAPRHFDLLNYFLIRPWSPYSVLALRRLAVLVYASLLLLYATLWFRLGFGLTAFLVVAACLLFDFYEMPTWSHNWWYRDLLLAHHAVLTLSYDGKKWHRWGLSLAGFLLGLIIVAYTTQIAALAGVGLMWFAMTPWFKKGGGKLPGLGNYFAFALVPILLDLGYIFGHGIESDWWQAFRSVALIPDYSGNSSIEKFFQILNYVISAKDLWVFLFLATLGISFASRRSFRWAFPMLALVGFYLWRRTGITGQSELLLKGYVGWMTGALLWLWGLSLAERNPLLFFIAWTTATTAGIAAISSHAGAVSLFWAVPAVVIPAAALLTEKFAASRRPAMKLAHGLLLLFVGTLGYGAAHWQLTTCYRDVSPRDCTWTVSARPFQGLRTNPIRGALVDRLSTALTSRHLVLAYPNLPGIFLFPHLQSAADTTLINFAFPTRFDETALEKMVTYHRYPEVVVKVKVEPWTWGKPPTNYLAFPADRPLVVFADCVRGKEMFQAPELEIYEARPELVERCARRSSGRPDWQIANGP